jgi:hypothetical protein
VHFKLVAVRGNRREGFSLRVQRNEFFI